MNPDDFHDPDLIYARTLEACRQMGIEPPTLERARQLVSEWNAMFAEAGEPPAPRH